MRFRLAAILLLALVVLAQAAGPGTLTQHNESPLISFRILFHTGAASDPVGKEGVAALTAAMLSKAGSASRSYDEIIQALFPMAASIDAQVDKEMTVFHGTTHVENLEAYYGILREMLLTPGWREDDFKRLKDEAINFLRIELRGNNEEELGKEALYLRIYEGHPYGHHNVGSVAAIEKLTLDDLKSFYAKNFTRDNVEIAIAGGYPGGFDKRVVEDFTKLPEGKPMPVDLPAPARAKKLRVTLIEKNTRGVLISLGFPIDATRNSADWPALSVMQSYFGQHRTSKSYLYTRIREIRGMNYGDYAYIEYFPRGMFQFQPDPNLGRRQQIFQIWIRPVEPQNGMFALRIALYELNKLVNEGMTAESFEPTRKFLSKFVNLLTQTQQDRLGYALDSRYYGIGEFNGFFKDAIGKLTVEDVNAAIKKHLRSTDLDVVVITKDAAAFRRAMQAGTPSTIQYASPPPKEILDEDKLIGRYPLDLGDVRIVPADTIFEK